MYIFFFVFCVFGLFCNEEIALQNIRQLTFSHMGFEKAGEAYFSPDDSSILFQAVPKGEQYYQIYRMDLEEGVPSLVSTGKGRCTCAFFHPSGKKIIFASSHEDTRKQETSQSPSGKYQWDLTPFMNIYEADPDGSNLKQLTFGPAYHAECAYSPDGQEIVYASNELGSMNIFIMDFDGTNVRQITHGTSCYNGGPFFSPDGKNIIFRADREIPDYLQIFLIGTDGQNELQLTDNQAVNWAPYFHPSGNLIAYTTSAYGHHCYSIELLNIYTHISMRLTYGSTFDGLPVFSHDGKKIMWTSKRGPDKTCQIFIADILLPKEIL